jgi:two-component system sensor histidine kinase HydH
MQAGLFAPGWDSSAAEDIFLADSNEHRKQLEELGRLTGELAHEIKNPLSTIKINLRLIAEELQSPDIAEPERQPSRPLARALRKINVIQKEADRLEQILDSFLRYVDRPRLQPASIDVNSLISDMVDFYTPQARSRSITIRQRLYAQPLVCKIDQDMIKQVFLNLFINAQQAMSKGGELLIRTDRRQDRAIITVGDTGGGIAPDKLADIFNAERSFQPRGTGLGLPTARRIVESHNGTIEAESEQGKGTLFTIKLPLQTL